MNREIPRFATRPIELPVLVVGSVGGAWREAEFLVAEHAGRARRVVFLGDYWGGGVDGDGGFEATCSWLFESLRDARRMHLAGPQELQFVAPSHPQVRIDGWTRYRQGIFDLIWGEAFRALLALAVRAGEWVVSNQGFGPEFVHERSSDDLIGLADDARWRALLGREDPLLAHWQVRREPVVTSSPSRFELNGRLQANDGVSQVVRCRWPLGCDLSACERQVRAPGDATEDGGGAGIEPHAGHCHRAGRVVFVGPGPLQAVLLHADGRVERVGPRRNERTCRTGPKGAFRL